MKPSGPTARTIPEIYAEMTRAAEKERKRRYFAYGLILGAAAGLLLGIGLPRLADLAKEYASHLAEKWHRKIYGLGE